MFLGRSSKEQDAFMQLKHEPLIQTHTNLPSEVGLAFRGAQRTSWIWKSIIRFPVADKRTFT